jgi:hypothetical protein
MTTLLVTCEIHCGGLPTQIAVNALIVHVIATQRISWVPVCNLCHKLPHVNQQEKGNVTPPILAKLSLLLNVFEGELLASAYPVVSANHKRQCN